MVAAADDDADAQQISDQKAEKKAKKEAKMKRQKSVDRTVKKAKKEKKEKTGDKKYKTKKKRRAEASADAENTDKRPKTAPAQKLSAQSDGPPPAAGAVAGTDSEVFLRYVPYAATSAELQQLFTTTAPELKIVRVKLMPGREEGKNSGVGFVTFATAAAASSAVAKFDGCPFQGRSLAVCLAKDRRSSGPLKPIQAAPAAVVVPPDCRSVLVENLVHGCSQRDVRAIFPRATNVVLLGRLGKARVGFLNAEAVRPSCVATAPRP